MVRVSHVRSSMAEFARCMACAARPLARSAEACAACAAAKALLATLRASRRLIFVSARAVLVPLISTLSWQTASAEFSAFAQYSATLVPLGKLAQAESRTALAIPKIEAWSFISCHPFYRTRRLCGLIHFVLRRCIPHASPETTGFFQATWCDAVTLTAR